MLYRFDDVVVDPSAYQATRDGETLPLQPKMFELLCHLLDHRDRVVTREELLSAFWPNESVGDAVVTWTISHIRKQIGPSSGNVLPIATVHGRGYRFTADVVVEEAPDQSSSPPARVGAPPVAGPLERASEATPFVGREVAMRSLENRLAETGAGRGGLCLLVGEAGIGKTRCARVLLARARSIGSNTLVGKAVEGAPVFWPWLQVVRQLGDGSPDHRERALGLHAELSALHGRDSVTAGSAAPDRRFWLYDELTKILVASAHERPLVVLLDDLQWADEGTLEALRFVAAEVAQARVLIVATHRERIQDTQGEPQLPPAAVQLELGRLTPGELARYVAGLTGTSELVSAPLVAAIHRATAGNPLFVEETLRGLLAEHGAQGLLNVEPVQIQPPTIARDVLLVRLSQLPEEVRSLLVQASVLGEVFGIAALEAISGKTMSTLIRALQKAANSAFVIAQSPSSYRFSHALHREVLYDAMPSQERVAAHRRAVHALEDRGAIEMQAAEVARHYYRSLPAGDFPAVVEAARRAAHAAEAVLAHGDAAKYYGWALEAQALDRDLVPRGRAELLLAAGMAQRQAGRDGEARVTLKRMSELAHQHGYADLLLQGAATLRPTFMLGTVPDPLARDCLEHVLRLVPEGPDPIRIGALGLLACTPPYSADVPRSKQMCGQALAGARELGQGEPLLESLRASFYAMSGPGDTGGLLELVDEVLLQEEGAGSPMAVDAYAARTGAYLYIGDVDGADAAVEALGKLAANTRLVEAAWYHLRQRAQREFREGHFDIARATCDVLEERSERMGLSYGPTLVQPIRHTIALERTGREPLVDRQAYGILAAGDQGVAVEFHVRLTRAAAEAGFDDLARAGLSGLASGGFARIPKVTSYLSNLSHLARASLALPERPFADQLYELLAEYPHHNTPDMMFRYDGSVSRFLALLAIGLGLHDRVQEHFEDALTLNERIRHLPVLARTRLEYATWLMQEGTGNLRTRGVEVAREAADVGRQVGMTWLVERAEALL